MCEPVEVVHFGGQQGGHPRRSIAIHPTHGVGPLAGEFDQITQKTLVGVGQIHILIPVRRSR